VLMGKPFRDLEASEYYKEFALRDGWKAVKRAFEELKKKYEVIIIEGAGSPAEINLYDEEISNMKTAEITNSPVILLGDIERGGVFASLYGTFMLLKKRHRKRVKGFVINKFRGEPSILEPGLEELEKLTGVKVLGVLPYVLDLKLPQEDSLGLEDEVREGSEIEIEIIKLPRISNFTDFDALKTEGVSLKFVEKVGDPDALIIPGTKNTIKDLLWLRERRLDREILRLSKSIPIIGICGGYQMLGGMIYDPNHIESEEGSVKGLGLLDLETEFLSYEKVCERMDAKVISCEEFFSGLKNTHIKGYEIHMGKTELKGKPLFKIGEREEGTISKRVFGTYLHGLFDNCHLRDSFLNYLRERKGIRAKRENKKIEDEWNQSLDRLSEIFLQNVNLEKIFEIMGVER
ncbi:MAG: cobyric acid synthase, partial [Candidatus Methanofastidiosia archaeon]